jgi:hypothetical protein
VKYVATHQKQSASKAAQTAAATLNTRQNRARLFASPLLGERARVRAIQPFGAAANMTQTYETLQYIDSSDDTQEVALSGSNISANGPATPKLKFTPVSHGISTFVNTALEPTPTAP